MGKRSLKIGYFSLSAVLPLEGTRTPHPTGVLRDPPRQEELLIRGVFLFPVAGSRQVWMINSIHPD